MHHGAALGLATLAAAGCGAIAPDFGVTLTATGPTAVGALNDIYVGNVCLSRDLPVPCQTDRTISIRQATVSDPTVVSIESATAAGPIVIRALRAGVTQLSVTVDRDDGLSRTATGTLETSDPKTIDIEGRCSYGRLFDPILLPQGAEWVFNVDVLGPRPGMRPDALTVLGGRDIMPFSLGSLNVIGSGLGRSLTQGSLFGTSSMSFRIRADDYPSTTAITTPLDPSFVRTIGTFAAADVDGLALVPDQELIPLRPAGQGQVGALHAVHGQAVCNPANFRNQGTATTDTPDVCRLLGHTVSGSAVDFVEKFDVWALAPGPCHVTAMTDDGRGPASVVVTITDNR